MKALILAGGLATRLRPLTEHIPKALLHIANRPFLEQQMRLLHQHGVTDVTLLTGYLAEEFGSFARDMQELLGMTLDISTESKPLGTAGAVRSQLERLDGTTLVFNGDVLTDIDLTALLARHRATEALLTITLTYVEDSDAFGLVPLRDDDSIVEFRQNPKTGTPQRGDWINAGMYALEPRALEHIPPDTEWSFETQTFPHLLAENERMYGYRSDAYWIDIGNPQRFLRAHYDILDGRAHAFADGQIISETKQFPDGTRIEAPVLLAHAPVGRGAVIGPHTTLGPRARIGEGAVIERSVIHAEADIGDGAVIKDSIVGRGARVEPAATLDGEVVA